MLKYDIKFLNQIFNYGLNFTMVLILLWFKFYYGFNFTMVLILLWIIIYFHIHITKPIPINMIILSLCEIPLLISIGPIINVAIYLTIL